MTAPMALDELLDDATAFLESTLPRRSAVEGFAWGRGSDRIAVIPEAPSTDDPAIDEARKYLAARFDAGFGYLTGPVEHGGRALPEHYADAYAALESAYEVPSLSQFGIGQGMVAPTILAHGTESARRAYLAPLMRGDIIACQLFSEPGAGSDLASVQCRAERDGDRWRLTGQKVWTSGGHLSDIGEVVCRTDPDVPKHRGLTVFVVDMAAPGVEVRPLRQMTGGAAFNEVFLDGAVVEDDHRLGEVDGGWGVAMTTLMNERSTIGAGGAGLPGFDGVASGERLIELLRSLGRATDPVLRQTLARVYAGFRTADLTRARAEAALADGGIPGPELAIAKLALTRNVSALASFAVQALGPLACADTGAWGTFAWNELLLGAPGLRLAGGTDEVLRNMIGERVLGLPREADESKAVPFRELRRSS